jgi:hypothetical protein
VTLSGQLISLSYIRVKLRINDLKMTPQSPGVVPATSKMDPDGSPRLVAGAPDVSKPLAEQTVWNTKHLGLRLASDFTSGFLAAGMVAPFITIIDKFRRSSCPKSLNTDCYAEQLCKMLLAKIRSRTL